jgi:hypothetical protein
MSDRAPHRSPEFLKFWVGQSVSLVGSEVSQLAMPVLAVLKNSLTCGSAPAGPRTSTRPASVSMPRPPTRPSSRATRLDRDCQ